MPYGAVDHITLESNLKGEVVNFSFNENEDTITVTANITLLFASSDEITQEVEIFRYLDTYTEDRTVWGDYIWNADLEINQLVMIWVIEGQYNLLYRDHVWSEYENAYISESIYKPVLVEGTGRIEETLWKVVDYSVYINEAGIPYADVRLESISAFIETAVWDASKVPYPYDGPSYYLTGEGVIYFRPYLEDLRYWEDFYSTEDSYIDISDLPAGTMYWGDYENWSDLWGHIRAVLVATYKDGTTGYYNKLRDLIYQPQELVNLWGATIADSLPVGYFQLPVQKSWAKGENIWEFINYSLAWNDLKMRFNKVGQMIWWEPSELNGWGEPVNIGDVESSVKIDVSKGDLFNSANVTGYVGTKETTPSGEKWVPDKDGEIVKEVTSIANDQLLNGEIIEKNLTMPPDLIAVNEVQVSNWGYYQLKAAYHKARTVTITHECIPWTVEVGHVVKAESELGNIEMFVSSLSRSIDIYSQTAATTITGPLKRAGSFSWA
jgi:hypothetical protein